MYWRIHFNVILNNLSYADKIGHLFIADIKFHVQDEKTMLFNEIYTLIFEKSKLIKPYERSVLQLLSVLSRKEEKDIINTFKHNATTYSTIKEKKFIPLCAEHMHFLVTRAGWLFTKIYEHCTFEQALFKKEFVTINQNGRQKAESSVEGDFYKLMNNSNFGIDCRYNIDNCKFETIYDEIGKKILLKNMKIYLETKNIKSSPASKQCVKKSNKHLTTNFLHYNHSQNI